MAIQRQKGLQAQAEKAGKSAIASKAVAASALSARLAIKGPKVTAQDVSFWTYRTIREGVPASSVKALEKADIVNRDDIRMIIPDRTLERRIKAQEPLKTEEADGIARLIRVVAHARRVFDDVDLADEWLRSPNPALSGAVPIRMAATDIGAREVEVILGRIEHGVFS